MDGIGELQCVSFQTLTMNGNEAGSVAKGKGFDHEQQGKAIVGSARPLLPDPRLKEVM